VKPPADCKPRGALLRPHPDQPFHPQPTILQNVERTRRLCLRLRNGLQLRHTHHILPPSQAGHSARAALPAEFPVSFSIPNQTSTARKMPPRKVPQRSLHARSLSLSRQLRGTT
jgi:hypothetical protein